jgi:hypothetical protein
MLFFGAWLLTFDHPGFVQWHPGKIFKIIQDFSHFNHPPAEAVPLLFLLLTPFAGYRTIPIRQKPDRRGHFLPIPLFQLSHKPYADISP